jgi:hypothetical protein
MPEGIATITEEDVATGKLILKIDALNEAKVLQYKLAALTTKQEEAAGKVIDEETKSLDDNISNWDILVARLKNLTDERQFQIDVIKAGIDKEKRKH